MTIRLHSRIAIAAVIAPLTLLAAACGDDSSDNADGAGSDPASSASSEPTTSAPTETPSSDPTQTATETPDAGGVDYVANGVWHRADGDAVNLPEKEYFGAVVWNDQLVATRTDGEIFAIADVVAEDGTVVKSFPTTSSVVVNEAGTTIAWVDTDGEVMTAWEGDQVSLGNVDLSAPGETIAYFAAAVTGGPNCYEAVDGCVVFVNSGVGKPQVFDSHGVNDNPIPAAIEYGDVSADGVATYVYSIDDDGSCSGLVELPEADTEPAWDTCDHEAAQIAPDGKHVIGLPSYYDGLGITDISALDAADGTETGRYAPEGGFISQWAWTTDGRILFDVYGGGKWQLVAMTTDGEITEVGAPVQGKEFDSPFTLVQH